MKPEDKRLIIEFGILAIISTVCIVGTILIMILVFFYGNPLTIVLCCILIMLRIRVCDTGTEVTLVKVLRKYFKVSITIMK